MRQQSKPHCFWNSWVILPRFRQGNDSSDTMTTLADSSLRERRQRMMKRLLQRIISQRIGVLRLAAIGVLSLALLTLGGVALAAPATPVRSDTTAHTAAGSQAMPNKRGSVPQAAPTLPSCDAVNNPNQCVTNITTPLGKGATAIFQFGIWAIVVLATLVVLYQILQAITKGGVSGNAQIIKDVVWRIAIVGILVFLAINSQTIMNWFLGGSTPAVSPPTWPTISSL